jgi:hypothetical protein
VELYLHAPNMPLWCDAQVKGLYLLLFNGNVNKKENLNEK